jgi:hypothetical protein
MGGQVREESQRRDGDELIEKAKLFWASQFAE